MTEEGTMHTFHTPNPVNLRVELWQGRVDVQAEDTDTTTVELLPLHADPGAQDLIDSAKVEQRGDDIVVLMPKIKSGLFRRNAEVEARIVVPTNSRAKLETASADITTRGALGNTKAYSGSGEVSLQQVADVEVRTGSGDISIETATGSCDSKSGSAEVTLGTIAGDADIMSGSGDVVISEVQGGLKVKAGSGDIVLKSAGKSIDAMAGSGDLLLKRVDRGRVKAKTGSGDITIGVASGTAAYLDVMTVTGDVQSELDGSEAPTDGDLTVEISAQTGSGDVVLQRA
jgi:DUF4097 and DUF4098 domain-containing protein YvlB